MHISLSRLSFFNTISSILLFSIVLGSFIYMFSDNLYNNKVTSLEKNFYQKNKILVEKEVKRMIRNIHAIRDNIYEDSKKTLQEKVDIVQHLFDNDKSTDKLAILLHKYKNVLDTIKWSNNTGYIYIYDENGTILYHGVNKNSEEKNIFELTKGNKQLSELLKKTMVNEKSFGSYKWIKPKENKNIEFDKFVYIQKDKKFKIYIAAGIYKEELDKKILDIVAEELYVSKFGENDYGYFWINTLDYKMKIHPLNRNLEGKDISSIKMTDDKFLFKEINAKALEGGGFLEYQWFRPDSMQKDDKVSYVKLINGYSLVIGSGFYLTELKEILQKEKNNLRQITDDYMVNVLLILICMLIVTIIITKFISLRIKRIEDERVEQLNMLEQYKLVLDKSSLVSKTNKKGIITYVNNNFREISGYSNSELIGEAHSIVRHPESKRKQFKKLWETIQDGKIWMGIIKNKNKNGNTYFNKTTIVPIKDSKGEILEYISSGSDVTELFDLHQEIEDTQKEVIYKMGEIGETRSKETGNHVKRVAKYSRLLANLYGLDSNKSKVLFTASPMHDIGKVGIPDSILKKPGKLTEEEFTEMKTHVQIGFDILKNSKREVLQAAAIVAHEHHEKWDGTGYPQGLKGNDIHIYGRITALADVFDALGTERCYKASWSDEKIFKLLEEESGKHFDPKLIELFFDNFELFDEIRKKYKD